MSKDKNSPNEAVWQETPNIKEPIYKINEKPKTWWESILYGWQHTLVDISPFVLPLAVAGAIGMGVHEQAQFINFCLCYLCSRKCSKSSEWI